MGFSRQEYWSGVPLPSLVPELCIQIIKGFPCGSAGKESTCSAGDLGSISGLGTIPGGGHVTHFSILAWRFCMDRGACQAIVHGVTESGT